MAGRRDYTEEEAEQILRLAAQQGSGKIPQERLRLMASELGISDDQLAEAEATFLSRQAEDGDRARFRANARREFWSHFTTFAAVNAGLVVLDLLDNGRFNWFWWPLAGWGMGLLLHAVGTFFKGSVGEEQEYQKWKALQQPIPLTSDLSRHLEEIASTNTQGKLEAIKEVRRRLGMDLKQAKDAVDQYEREHPGVFTRW